MANTNMVQNMDVVAGTATVRWWSMVGDNGLGVACYDGLVLEAVQKLKNVSIMEMPSEEMARQYAYNAYIGRYTMRNYSIGEPPRVPLTLPPNYICIDPEFEQREGNRMLTYFPGVVL